MSSQPRPAPDRAEGPQARASGPQARASGVVLVGPPGAGKSTIGPLLADRLGVPFVDTDLLVEQAAGMPVSDIFISEGEARFRALEAEAVAHALAAPQPGVVALGGGAVMDPNTRALLVGRVVVYLEVSWDVAARRVGLNQARPLLIGNPRAQWRALMDQRRPLYEQVATLTVPTGDADPPTVTERILAMLPADVAGRP